MAKFKIYYARYKLKPNGVKGASTTATKNIDAPTVDIAVEMIKSHHPGLQIEPRKIKEL